MSNNDLPLLIVVTQRCTYQPAILLQLDGFINHSFERLLHLAPFAVCPTVFEWHLFEL